MSKNWLTKWVTKNPTETTQVVSNSLDAITKINLNETFSQFNRMAENINRGKEIENERIQIENTFVEKMTEITSTHEEINLIINKNNEIIDDGLKNNDYEKIRTGVAGNVHTVKELLQGLNGYKIKNKQLNNNNNNNSPDNQQYIDIT